MTGWDGAGVKQWATLLTSLFNVGSTEWVNELKRETTAKPSMEDTNGIENWLCMIGDDYEWMLV